MLYMYNSTVNENEVSVPAVRSVRRAGGVREGQGLWGAPRPDPWPLDAAMDRDEATTLE